jgi:5-oxopent-3-ene-1,2,5-tricarboxylate decarboxylase/2-hydroxyhepta-2,4-diene-1,7-dioate isomerase
MSERKELRRIVYAGREVWGSYGGGLVTLPDGTSIPETEAVHLAPAEPKKILCIHLNYEQRRTEMRETVPLLTPNYFQKPVSALNAHGGALVRPAGCKYINYEGELAVIVGAVLSKVSPSDVWAGIAGYACANDVGCQDFRDTDAGSMLRVKGMDGFCPVGPGIVSGIDPRHETIRTYVNGRVVQEARLDEMMFGIDYILSDLSRFITLEPGDVILTGTPANSRPLSIGDIVEVEVTNVGRLRNHVVAGPPPGEIGHQPTDTPNVRRVALGGDFYEERVTAGGGVV